MGRSHLKVYFDFEEKAKQLNDAEKGRLLLAMLRYAANGAEPNISGNERFLFPVFKSDIDYSAAVYATKVNNGQNGGRPAKNTQEKPNETENNRNKPKQTETAKNKTEDKEKREKKEETEEEEEEEGEAATAGQKKIDFELLAATKIEKAAKDWGVPYSKGCKKIALELAVEYTLEWVLLAIERSGRRRCQSWGYITGILQNWKEAGRVDDVNPIKEGKTSKGSTTVSAQNYTQRAYTEEELTNFDIEEEIRLFKERQKAKEENRCSEKSLPCTGSTA